MSESPKISVGKGLLGLSPLLVFIVMYLVVSLLIDDFYKVPLTVAFIVSAIWGICVMSGIPFRKRIDIFTSGASDSNIIYMVWVFLLAGAFAMLAKKIGATEATVNFALSILPNQFLMPGLFLSACFISMAIGTSVGTIVALTPVAIGISQAVNIDTSFFVAIIVGGAFFGDNLSFISDTTIASTRSLNCKMNDKFKANIWLALPSAIIVFIYYIYAGVSVTAPSNIESSKIELIIPYLLVIITAVCGWNVLIVLLLGIISSVIIGLFVTEIGIMDMVQYMGNGIDSVGNLVIVTLLAAGMLGIIKCNGGIDYLIQILSKNVSGKRGAQACIALLVGMVNICTANNTVAIITVGPLVKDVSDKFHLDKRKAASLLDTCSCITQALLPYGAQVLMASSLAAVTPLSIIPYLYYPMILGIMVILSIAFKFPKSHN